VVRIFLDTADIAMMHKFGADKRVMGFTTNPALMKKSGIGSYRNFASIVLGIAAGRPVSFEVTADDFATMERQARELASWGDNVWVKIPITNTRGESCVPLVKPLNDMRLNITAVMTRDQIDMLAEVDRPWNIVSIFAGRIADTGRDPDWHMAYARGVLKKSQLLWASAREVLNVYQAEARKCDIITLTPDLIAKLDLHGKSLAEYSLETVKMFHNDGKGIAL
jgi:transaldolase